MLLQLQKSHLSFDCDYLQAELQLAVESTPLTHNVLPLAVIDHPFKPSSIHWLCLRNNIHIWTSCSSLANNAAMSSLLWPLIRHCMTNVACFNPASCNGSITVVI